MTSEIIIGTRGSELALWQAHHVQDLLQQKGVTSTIHIIKTKGDNIQHLGFDKMEGKGFFTKEIEDALLKNEIDIAVHSHKDLETDQPQGLVIGAVSPRADARELLLVRPDCVDKSFPLHFKKNAIVGTSSARRKAQLLHLRRDVELADIRGNVPTRIQKLRDGQYDAILLAKAGVDRLEINLDGLYHLALPEDEFVPAPAQGVLGIQCRENDKEIIALLSSISDKHAYELISIERSVLNKLHGGCQLPFGIYAQKTNNEFKVFVAIAESWNSPLKTFTLMHTDAQILIENVLEEIKK